MNNEKNSVTYLQNIRFSDLKFQEQLDIKSLGRLTPALNISQTSKSRNHSYNRKFHSGVYNRHNWLTGCSDRNAFFCFTCLLFGGDSSWTEIGISDLKHLSEKIKKHEKSAEHLENVCDLAMLGTLKTQLSQDYRQVIIDHNENVKRNRQILSKIIDAILFCGKFGLRLQDDDQSEDSINAGVFRGLLEYTGKIDDNFKSHFSNSSVFKGPLKTIQNELVDCILSVCRDEILAEIKTAQFLAVMVEDTTDISELPEQAIVFRYQLDGIVYERFWGFFNPKSQSDEDLAECISEQLNVVLNEERDKLIAQSYDGGAALSGINGGVQTILKKSYKNAHFIHCYAHKLKLIMEKAASQNSQARIFFSSLTAISAFFNKSPARLAALEDVSKQDSKTRWNFKGRIVNTVYENKDVLMQCFEFLQNNTNVATEQAATTLIQILNDENFNFWLKFFHEILPHIDTLNKKLHNRNANSVSIYLAVENFCKIIMEKRNNFSLQINQTEYEPPTKKTRISETNNIAAEEVCDHLILQAKERFSFTKHLSAAQLLSPYYFQSTNEIPIITLQETVEAYPNLDKDRLSTELRVLYERQEFKNLQGIRKIYEIMQITGIYESFVEVFKLLKIILTIPLTTAEPERCFSSLKRIKTFLRNTMDQNRLTALAMMSIEENMITNIDNFNNKVINKFENQNEGRIEFKFK